MGGGEESRRIKIILVRDAILPTTVEDARPFKSQSAHGGMVFLASLELSLVVELGPGTEAQGSPGKLVEALAKELWASPTPMHLERFAAALDDRGHAAEAGQGCGRGPA